MSYDINSQQVDIENLFKQNVNDLASIKELYRKLKEMEEKITQIKYIDSKLADKLKKDYEKLKRIILDENIQAKLTNDIKEIDTSINIINNDIDEINSQMDTKAKQVDLKVQEERINLLTKVQNGETDGNTELLDMRIGANGEVYSTSGNTIRTIGKALNYKTSKNIFNKNTITDNTSFYSDGNINSNSPGYCISDFIPTKLGEKIYGSYDGVSRTIDRYNVYNKEKTLLKSV